MRNIYLTGLPASGKSSIGNFLSQQLKHNFVDLDELIEKKEQQTVSQIFETKGEKYFRSLEFDELVGLANHHNLVIATGGGSLCNSYLMDLALQSGQVIYLKSDLKELSKRIPKNNSRPMFTSLKQTQESFFDYLKTLLDTRKQFYARAHHTIETESKTVEEICEEILCLLNHSK